MSDPVVAYPVDRTFPGLSLIGNDRKGISSTLWGRCAAPFKAYFSVPDGKPTRAVAGLVLGGDRPFQQRPRSGCHQGRWWLQLHHIVRVRPTHQKTTSSSWIWVPILKEAPGQGAILIFGRPSSADPLLRLVGGRAQTFTFRIREHTFVLFGISVMYRCGDSQELEGVPQ